MTDGERLVRATICARMFGGDAARAARAAARSAEQLRETAQLHRRHAVQIDGRDLLDEIVSVP